MCKVIPLINKRLLPFIGYEKQVQVNMIKMCPHFVTEQCKRILFSEDKKCHNCPFRKYWEIEKCLSKLK